MMDGIAKTSLLVAAMRAVETKRSDAEGRLFSDPFAEVLAGEEGFSLLKRAVAEVGDQPAIAVRTAFIDDRFHKALSQGVRQVVILAAGMDARPYRLNFPEDTRVFELDQEDVLNYKKEKLSKFNPRCRLSSIAVDLREDWPEKLLAAGFKRLERTLWTIEGLLMYLSESQVLTIFERVNALSTSKDILLFDVLSRYLLEAPHMKTQLQFLASLGAAWDFGTNEPEQYMDSLGWEAKITQPGEFAPRRWPFPTVPRNVPNVPRGFYVEARKR